MCNDFSNVISFVLGKYKALGLSESKLNEIKLKVIDRKLAELNKKELSKLTDAELKEELVRINSGEITLDGFLPIPIAIHLATLEMLKLNSVAFDELIERSKTEDIAISLIDSGMFDKLKPKRREILWAMKSCTPCKIGFIEGKMLHIDPGFLDHKKHQVIHFLIELNKQSPLYMYSKKFFGMYNNDELIYCSNNNVHSTQSEVDFNINELNEYYFVETYRIRQTNVKVNEYSYLSYDDRDCEFIETVVQIGDYNIKSDGSTIECINDRIIPFLIENSRHPHIRLLD